MLVVCTFDFIHACFSGEGQQDPGLDLRMTKSSSKYKCIPHYNKESEVRVVFPLLVLILVLCNYGS